MSVLTRVLAATGAAMLLSIAASCSSSGDTGTGGGGGSSTPNCADYCETVTANCTADHADYASKDVCMAACAHFPTGKASDTTGDTLGCRSYHAGAAKADPVTHCPHAGPGGAGYCGANCEGYCSLALGACPKVYKDETDCMTACAGFTDTEKATPPQYFSAQDVSGNTLQCRLYHASVASSDPTTHCPHIGPMPTQGTCTDP